MFNSYLHLYVLSDYLQQSCTGLAITAIYTFRKSHLILELSNGQALHLSCEGKLPYFTLEKEWHPPRKRYPLFESWKQCQIEKVAIHPIDRFLQIHLSNRYTLEVMIFANNANLHLIDQDGNLVDRFKSSRKIYRPLEYKAGIKPIIERFREFDESEFLAFARENQERSLKRLCNAYFLSFPGRLLEEIQHRTGIAPQRSWGTLGTPEIEQLLNTFKSLFKDLFKGIYYVYKKPKLVFSLLPLHVYSEVEILQDVALATNFYRKIFHQAESFRVLYKETWNALSQERESLIIQLNRQRQNSKNFPDPGVYRRYGDLLLMNLPKIPTGASSVTLPDPENDNQPLEIPLNPELNPQQNAQRYYQLMKKYSKGQEELEANINDIQERIKKIENLLMELEQIDELNALRNWRKQWLKAEGLRGSSAQKETDGALPYYRFEYQGWEILVGKSARKNLELTFKYASKNDFWLHAYGVSGSHVIVRNPGKLEQLPETILNHAGSLAARFSKAKHSSTVPVIYTKVKYVSRIKGDTTGKVKYQFEKTIFVTPASE